MPPMIHMPYDPLEDYNSDLDDDYYGGHRDSDDYSDDGPGDCVIT